MTNLSTRTARRAIGGLFLSAFFLYGGGSYLLASTTDGATPLPENTASLGQLSAGAALMLLNSAAVTAIGVLAFRVLRRRHRRTASTYLVTRAVEGVLLAIAPASMLLLVLAQGNAATSRDGDLWLAGLARAAAENGESTYWMAMAVLGAGSVVFCRALLSSGLLPRLLAVWGMVGYAVFALGGVLQLSGYEVGLALSAPGGLFEVAAGSCLLVKGFAPVTPVRNVPADQSGSGAAVGLVESGANA